MAKKKNGYPKWAKDNTSTVPYDPAQRIKRAKDDDKGIAPSVSTPAPTPPPERTQPGELQQKITDGSTDVVSSYFESQNPQLGELPQAKQHYPPCLNPRCKSHGKGHPNCLCYAGPGGTNMEDKSGWMAKGGVVGQRFCSKDQAHNPKCEYYADGGNVGADPNPTVQPPDDTEASVGHVAAEHGLLGLMKEIGHKKLQDHEKHTNKLRTEYDPKKFHGTALAGSASPGKLEPIMERLADPVAQKEPNSEAFRNSVDYLSSAMRGHNYVKNKADELFGTKPFSEKMEPDRDAREELKKHLESIDEDPSRALEMGGSLGHYLPEHSAALAAHGANAINYLRSLKPTQSLRGPLDEPSPIDKFAEEKYHRALDIANQPLMALHHAKEGILQPQDVKTLGTLFPGLHKSIVRKVGESLVDAKMNGIEIPHKQRQSVSFLMGQPLDSSFTPQSMQAIIRANAGAQMPQTQNNQGKPKKASGVELKQINKVNEMGELPNQARIADKKE